MDQLTGIVMMFKKAFLALNCALVAGCASHVAPQQALLGDYHSTQPQAIRGRSLPDADPGLNKAIQVLKAQAALQARTQEARLGDAATRARLARDLSQGQAPLNQDFQLAAYWAGLAASQGDASGQYQLAYLYENGMGLRLDLDKAAFWYKAAAEQGLVEAQLRLGHLYEAGQWQHQDPAQAAHWYGLAANAGDARAQLALGRLYARGQGLERDDQQAAHWFEAAAEAGLAEAQYRLASLYHQQQGLPWNDPKPLYWLKKAAAQRNVQAMDALSTLL
ncbi:tetratricopeptide repeat protein [Gallaecimonas kandeliae]|uniref:tetratricopeptide repeat protein n=1 Tax=Gallaecimonas kandeliae TaxID=3029055 RepID=UPI0026494584|nr:tetratricopeptide repeat protein [Gallaecimonas kandeliae]WKE66403.1 tetratricopeptide repeat protein [Gallaecimonas kandeliae]